MKKMFLFVFAMLMLANSASAELDFSLGYNSAYVFRGEKLLDNASLQPSIALTTDKVELRATSIYDTKTEARYRNIYQLTFKADVKKAKMSAGFIAYDQNKLRADTQEFFVGAEWDGALKPYMTAYFDMKEGKGSYVRAGIERQFKNMAKEKVVLGASVGYVVDNKYLGLNRHGKDFSGFYDGELYIKARSQLFKHVVAEPFIAYSFPLSRDGKDAIRALSTRNDSCHLYGGVNLLLSF